MANTPKKKNAGSSAKSGSKRRSAPPPPAYNAQARIIGGIVCLLLALCVLVTYFNVDAILLTFLANGFKKELEIQGVGYRAAKQGKNLVMNLGYSHQVIVPETDGITIDVPDPLKIVINGIDKQRVGQFAAEVREKRPPEPYKGKGIRYAGEYVAHKEGKAGKGAK